MPPRSTMPPWTKPAANPVPRLTNAILPYLSGAGNVPHAPSAAAFTSLSTHTGKPSSSDTRSPSSSASTPRLTTFSTRPVSRCTSPGMPIPADLTSSNRTPGTCRTMETVSSAILSPPFLAAIRPDARIAPAASINAASIFALRYPLRHVDHPPRPYHWRSFSWSSLFMRGGLRFRPPTIIFGILAYWIQEAMIHLVMQTR